MVTAVTISPISCPMGMVGQAGNEKFFPLTVTWSSYMFLTQCPIDSSSRFSELAPAVRAAPVSFAEKVAMCCRTSVRTFIMPRPVACSVCRTLTRGDVGQHGAVENVCPFDFDGNVV